MLGMGHCPLRDGMSLKGPELHLFLYAAPASITASLVLHFPLWLLQSDQ